MGVTALKAKLNPHTQVVNELTGHLVSDADRPEHRYLGTPLLELLTSGQLPKAALKDYAIQRWAFQAHANPAMMSGISSRTPTTRFFAWLVREIIRGCGCSSRSFLAQPMLNSMLRPSNHWPK